MSKYYFCGIAGSGMSALAQIVKMEGNEVEGSDRSFDKNENLDIKEKMIKLNIKIHKQDGNAITKSIDYFIYSTAVETNNPEYKKALELNLKIIHRSELLEEHVKKYKTIAIGGTSGKTTTTALIWHILNHSEKKPSLINGGYLISLMEKGLIGNAYFDSGDYLVIEADESDKTIKNYHPEIAIIHNITKDHKDVEELKEIFLNFALNSKKIYINEDDNNAYSLTKKIKNCKLYGKKSSKLELIQTELSYSKFKAYDEVFEIPLGGMYNIYNSLAAISICIDEGISINEIKKALHSFKGTFRRFNIIGTINKITVIDDYAHNPHKISSTIEHCLNNIEKNQRLIIIYQPHGFAPTRMFKADLIEIFKNKLRDNDMLIMPEIYYAGGNVKMDISSKDLIDEISNSKKAFYFKQREEILKFLSNIVEEGDLILIMGARDTTLHGFAKSIYKTILKKYGKIYNYE